MPAEPTGLPPRRAVYALTALLGIAYGVWIWRTGIQTSPDTASYSRWADQLIAHRFNFASYLRDQSFVVPPLLYLLWIALVAGLKTVLGTSWMSGLIVLNWIAFCTGMHLTLASVRRLTASTINLALAALLFLVAAELLIFIAFVLSDLIFWGLSTTVLACGVMLAVRRTDAAATSTATGIIIAGSALVAVAMAFRPVAIPLALFWVLSIVASRRPQTVARLAMPLFAVLSIAVAVAAAVHAYVMTAPSAWPFGSLPAMLQILSREYHEGVLVYGPGNTNLMVAPASSWIETLRLTVQKWAYFTTPWLPHYSTAHTVMNLAFFIPAYGLALVAVMNWRRLALGQQLTAWLLAAYGLTLSAFHAMIQIDYDHRYRLPLLPALIMAAAIGMEALRRRQRAGARIDP